MDLFIIVTPDNEPIINYLSIDVEDYYQVSAFEDIVSREKWDDFPSRVVVNTQRILDILEHFDVRATFFILGWTAERFPHLVEAINAKGHEVGCHSYFHRLVYDLDPDEFRQDTLRAKTVIEGIIGRPVLGYRAPSYSIVKRSFWALEILEELGFQYDSSIFPIHHDRYGVPDAPRFEYMIAGRKLKEYPISTVSFCGQRVPVSGGGYFRLLPYCITRAALRSINRRDAKPFVFYFHPWELDPAQPRFDNASALSRFRHYLNLDKTAKRLERMLTDFSFQSFSANTSESN
ncbi:XrtA system polysaccharide deacetylase [Thermodesulfobacteriota bacterium]